MNYVYVLTNSRKNVLYIGVTNNLESRLAEHYMKRGNRKTFTGRYACFNLLYFERFESIVEAIRREKQIKGWTRERKIALIKSVNPTLEFLVHKI